MKKGVYTVVLMSCLMVSSCGVFVNGPIDSEHTAGPGATRPQFSSFRTATLFPFDDNSNWWRYTESEGNRLAIDVTDTISDDHVLYYRISFQENRVDTTDDWFQRSSSGIRFGGSLVGAYELFLPAKLDSAVGNFVSGRSIVEYHFYDSMQIGKIDYQNVLVLRYRIPIIHGFDEIIMADSVGIVQLTDEDGRWPLQYTIDSCSVGGEVFRY